MKLALYVALIAPISILTPQTHESLSTELRLKDEELLSAVHRGNGKLWADLTTPDFLYIEDGIITSRNALLKELEEDGNAPLIIKSYEVHQVGDTATVIHHDDVPTRPLRDTSKMHFLFSETWQQIDGHWMLRLVDINRLRADPPSIALSRHQIDELLGTYGMGAKTIVLRLAGDRIMARSTGSQEVEWKAETRDVLFEPGDLLTRKIFQRDSTGKVTALINRDQASETVWVRRK